MAFNIIDFRSSFRNYEPASPANYEVVIANFPKKIQISNDISSSLVFRCESCSTPSRDFTTTDRITYGAPRKVVNGSTYGPVTLTFIVSDTMDEKRYFYSWQKGIYNNEVHKSSTGLNDIMYYSDYTTLVKIKSMDKLGKVNNNIVLHEAYPVSIQEIPLGWNSTNDYIKLSVVFNYRYFEEYI